MHTTARKIIAWLVRIIYVQLVVTLISLPILTWWGLPLSFLSPVGNIIFSPFLTLFLLLSSLLFFCELLHIPNQLFVEALEQLTYLWQKPVAWATNSWLIAFIQPSIWFTIIIIGCTLCILHYRRFNTIAKRTVGLAILFICLCSYLKVQALYRIGLDTITFNRQTITIVRSSGKTIVIDPGALGSSLSAPSWVEFTLAPELRKRYGSNRIDLLVLLKPGIMTFQAVETAAHNIVISECWCISWEGTCPELNRAFMSMKKTLESQGGHVSRFGKKSASKTVGGASVLVTSTTQNRRYKQVSYPLCSVNLIHEDKTTCVKIKDF